MKTAILIHGTCGSEEFYSTDYPSPSNSHWFPWLSKELIVRNIHTVALEIPKSYAIDYEVWKREFERFDVDSDTILVGHSCGGGFLIRWLSENPVTVGKVVLVAPWIDPFNSRETDFFKFNIDQTLTERVESLSIFMSLDDDEDIQESFKQITNVIADFELFQFSDKGHFCLGNLKTEKFPELLNVIIGSE